MTVMNQEQDQEQSKSGEQEPAQASSKACGGSEGWTAKRLATSERLREGRLQRLPGGDYATANDGLTAVVLLEKSDPCAYGFRGRSMKAAFRYRFQTAEARAAYVQAWLERENVEIAERQAREVKTRARHTLALGDVLYSTWGYEQTNVDFYEVVAVRGACVDLRELRQNRNEHTIGMQGTCTARPGDYKGALIRGKRPNGNNWVRIESFAVACRWDGRPVNWSSYA